MNEETKVTMMTCDAGQSKDRWSGIPRLVGVVWWDLGMTSTATLKIINHYVYDNDWTKKGRYIGSEISTYSGKLLDLLVCGEIADKNIVNST